MTNDTTVDIQIIEKEIENAIDEKDLYRKKIIKVYEENKIIEKACKIKGLKFQMLSTRFCKKNAKISPKYFRMIFAVPRKFANFAVAISKRLE